MIYKRVRVWVEYRNRGENKTRLLTARKSLFYWATAISDGFIPSPSNRPQRNAIYNDVSDWLFKNYYPIDNIVTMIMCFLYKAMGSRRYSLRRIDNLAESDTSVHVARSYCFTDGILLSADSAAFVTRVSSIIEQLSLAYGLTINTFWVYQAITLQIIIILILIIISLFF